MPDETTTYCLGCGRRNPLPARVHEGCRQRAAERLAELPRLYPLMRLAVIPGGTGTGDGLKHRKADAAPMPLRLDAFNLLTAGALDDIDPRSAGDQVGMLPLHVWLDAWRDDFGERYGFATAPMPDTGAPTPSARLRRHLLTRSEIVTETYYGAGDGYRTTAAINDTLDAEHVARFGREPNPIAATVAALATRLDAACDEHPHIADFLDGLGIMVGACKTVVGERSDLIRLGRCPEMRRDRETGDEMPCGAQLWQDPYVTTVRCPRCKTEWPERRWLWLGTMIRARWPEVAAVHGFAAELVVVSADLSADPTVLGDTRFWAASCSCGQWCKQVYGNKIDARGAWRVHVDEASAPMVVEIGDDAA